MVALVSTVAYLGLEARSVEVQCQVAAGMPCFHVVGLPDKAIGESRQRVTAALSSMGLALAPKRITVNLSPADLPKEGSHYDLPIALSLLAAMGVADAEQLADFVAVDELALDGRVIPSPGVLLAALHASAAASLPTVKGSLTAMVTPLSSASLTRADQLGPATISRAAILANSGIALNAKVAMTLLLSSRSWIA